MGNQWIDRVISLLQLASYRAQRGYPVGKMPYLTAPAVAVCVEKIVPDGITLRLDIYCPLKLGGEKCEDTAAGVLQTLVPLGGVLSAGPCRFDESVGLFTQSVEAAFTQSEEPESE